MFIYLLGVLGCVRAPTPQMCVEVRGRSQELLLSPLYVSPEDWTQVDRLVASNFIH